MKSLGPNFLRSKRIVSAGFLAAGAGIFLSIPALAVPAGQAAPVMPQWYPFEMKAINLYETGISLESSDAQGAVTTLRQARQESTQAIANGGSGNQAVMHNDWLIGQALTSAQSLTSARADTAKTPETKKAPEKQKTGINLVRAGGSRSQAAGKLH